MKVKFDLGFRGVARSFRNEICILAPGSCMPACQANCDCRSRKETLAEDEASERAMAIAREAGPKPMQIRSWTDVAGDDFEILDDLSFVSRCDSSY